MMVVSIGLSTALRNIFQIVFGPDGKRYTAASGQVERSFGPVRLTPNDLLIMGICVAVLVGMTFLLRRTRLGTAIRAVADNPDLAASSGIAVDRIITTVWALCGALAAACSPAEPQREVRHGLPAAALAVRRRGAGRAGQRLRRVLGAGDRRGAGDHTCSWTRPTSS